MLQLDFGTTNPVDGGGDIGGEVFPDSLGAFWAIWVSVAQIFKSRILQHN